MNRTVILIGMMGVGKSTVGCLLSQKLDLPFLDTDQLVADKGRSIEALFACGEDKFREVERLVCQELCNRLLLPSALPHVISVGGGVPADRVSWNSIKDLGRTIYLKATPATLANRICSDNISRPLLRGFKSESEVEALLQYLLSVREGFYNGAQHVIETDNLSPADVSSNIVEYLKCRDA